MKSCNQRKMTAFDNCKSHAMASLFRWLPRASIGIGRNITPFRGSLVVEKWMDVACCPASRGRLPCQERIEQMESLLKGRLRNSHLAFTKAMIPLFEAVVNSIQSIEDDSAGDGRPIREHRVEIRVFRSDQTSLKLDGKPTPREPIIGFEIEDDGVGFTQANWTSFGLLDSLEKASRGCRGIGRLTWLKAFDRVRVESAYVDGGGTRLRKFSFDPNSSVHDDSDEAIEALPRKTVVRLERFDRRYAEHAPKTARTIAVAILEHCLWYFVRDEGVPKVVVEDGEERIDLDDLFDEHMHASAKVEPVEVKGQSFDLTHVKFRAAVNKTHQINYCAAGRVVREEAVRDKVPGLNGVLSDPAGSFTYAAYLTGEFFNERVSGQRVDFNIDETASAMFGATEIAFEDIRSAILPKIRDFLSASLDVNIAAARERIDAFVSNKAPRYRPILQYVPEEDLAVDPNISDANLDALLHKQLFRVEQGLISEGHKVLAPGADEAEEDYTARLESYLQRVSDLKRSDLADYVMHRRTIIDLLDKAIQRSADGSFVREDMIHRLIVPMRTTSDELKFRRNSLWLIDERLAFHDFLASDRPLRTMPITASESTKEPDIASLRTFNNPLAVSENDSGPQASITVVEIKRPMRKGYVPGVSEEDDPVLQALGYLRRLRQGAETKTGRTIPNADKIPGFVYVLADLTKSLKESCEFHQLKPTADGMGYFGYHASPSYNAYIQVISFEGLVASAKERHRAFFDQLGLPTN